MIEAKGFDTFLERTGKVRVIVTKKKYREKPFCIVPIWDDNEKDFVRYPSGLPEKKMKEIKQVTLKVFPNIEDQVFVDHNKELDKSKDNDYALLMLLLAQFPTVVKSQSEVVPGVTIAYIHDQEHEANITIRSSRTKFQAMAKVVDMSAENQRRMMFYFGENPDLLSPSILESTLYAKAEKNPEQVLEFFSDGDAELITMVNIMRKETLITRNKEAYYYNKIFLGQNIREVVSWTKEDKNAEVFALMRKQMKSSLISLTDDKE